MNSWNSLINFIKNYDYLIFASSKLAKANPNALVIIPVNSIAS